MFKRLQGHSHTADFGGFTCRDSRSAVAHDMAGNLRRNIKVSQIIPAEWNLVRGAHLLAMLGTLGNRLRGHFGGGAHLLAMLGTLGNRLRGHFAGGAHLPAMLGTLGNRLRGHFAEEV